MACRNHPQVEVGLDHCYRCGFRFCEECRVDFQGKPHCAPCKAEAVGMLESGQSVDAPHGGGELPPWERRQQLGMAAAFWATIKQVMSDPAGFYRRLDKTVTTWDCLAVPCVLQVIASIVSGIFNMVFLGGMAGIMGNQGGGDAAVMVGSQAFGACLGVVFAPVAAIIGVFIGAGLIHLWLMMTSKVGAPFHQTMRGYCYAQSPVILAVIPILGQIVGGLWAVWTAVVMVKETHRTTWGTAWMSVLWFLLLILCLGGAVAVIVLGVMSQQ